MLRSVGLAHRRHLEHSAVLAGFRSSLVSPLRPAHPLNCPRCTSTAAVTRPRTPRPSTRDANPDRVPSHGPTTPTPSHFQDGKIPRNNTQPQLPSSIFVAVDSLLSHNAPESSILKSIHASPLLSEYLLDSEKARRLAEAVARTHFPQRSHRILSLAHKLGCRLKQSAYECVCFQLASMRRWQMVLSTVALGKRHTGRTTARLLNWRARALVETQHYALLQGITREFQESSLRPSRRTYHLVLSGHIRNGDLARAKECLREMATAGFPPDASTHAIVATHHRHLGADSQVQSRALGALPVLRTATATSVVNSLMQLRLDAHDLAGSLQLLSLFEEHAVVSIFAATGGTGPVGAAGNIPLSLNTYSREHRQLFPTATTFSIFINYMATQSNLPGALQILQSMTTLGITPTSGTVTSLLHAHFAAGRGGNAVRMVAEMCDPEASPLDMFSPIMLAANEDKLPLNLAGLSPTVQVFNALLRGVLVTHGLKSITVILRIMHANHIDPNSTTLEIVIAYLVKVERARPRFLLRFLRKLSSPNLRPSLRHLHLILSSVLRREKQLLHGTGWNAIAASVRRQERFQRPPESRTSTTTNNFDPTAGIELPRGLSQARPLLQSLSSRLVRSDGAMIALRIRLDAVTNSDMETAREVFHAMLVRGMHPTEYHFGALMEGFVQSGDLESAKGVIKSAERAGVKPNVVMFTILIAGHARQGQPDLAVRTFQHMVASGVKPDVPAIDAVASAFFAVRAYAMARRILIALWPHIQTFPQELRGATLKVLAQRFRLLHNNDRDGPPTPSKHRRLILHWKLTNLLMTWKSGGGSTRYLRPKASSIPFRAALKSQDK